VINTKVLQKHYNAWGFALQPGPIAFKQVGKKPRRCTLHRLFSTFPGGSQGVGLLLLRAAVGVLAIVHGALFLAGGGRDAVYISAVGALAMAAGLSLLAGFLTPFAAGLALLGGIGIQLSWLSLPSPSPFETKLTTGLAMVVALAVVLLGPGALSLDARLFGRREIIIPRVSRPPKS
jgi:uncharacterized membrane protein YphA (DoxX/SURF4 family)